MSDTNSINPQSLFVHLSDIAAAAQQAYINANLGDDMARRLVAAEAFNIAALDLAKFVIAHRELVTVAEPVDDTAPYGIGDLVEHQSDGRIGAVLEIWQRPDSGQWVMSVRAADNGATKKWLAEDVELYSAFTPNAEIGPVTR